MDIPHTSHLIVAISLPCLAKSAVFTLGTDMALHISLPSLLYKRTTASHTTPSGGGLLNAFLCFFMAGLAEDVGYRSDC